jgi:hypothetical protein
MPLIGLGRALQQRRHECFVLGNAALERHATEQGVPFVAVAPARADMTRGLRHYFETSVFAAYRPTFEIIEQAVRARPDVCAALRVLDEEPLATHCPQLHAPRRSSHHSAQDQALITAANSRARWRHQRRHRPCPQRLLRP